MPSRMRHGRIQIGLQRSELLELCSQQKMRGGLFSRQADHFRCAAENR